MLQDQRNLFPLGAFDGLIAGKPDSYRGRDAGP
jgi:hypothetical protein